MFETLEFLGALKSFGDVAKRNTVAKDPKKLVAALESAGVIGTLVRRGATRNEAVGYATLLQALLLTLTDGGLPAANIRAMAEAHGKALTEASW